MTIQCPACDWPMEVNKAEPIGRFGHDTGECVVCAGCDEIIDIADEHAPTVAQLSPEGRAALMKATLDARLRLLLGLPPVPRVG